TGDDRTSRRSPAHALALPFSPSLGNSGLAARGKWIARPPPAAQCGAACEGEGSEGSKKLFRRVIGGIDVAEQWQQERNEALGGLILQDGLAPSFERRHQALTPARARARV
ncbi:MAG TPA: hypothetical protein PKE44_09425, partial [Plasticicumulans sp.]|uniref:hypothetical protein n=1 Tax=Plasticicumulans sp. TaxID=2307179 RepID=UPI002C25F04F